MRMPQSDIRAPQTQARPEKPTGPFGEPGGHMNCEEKQRLRTNLARDGHEAIGAHERNGRNRRLRYALQGLKN